MLSDRVQPAGHVALGNVWLSTVVVVVVVTVVMAEGSGIASGVPAEFAVQPYENPETPVHTSVAPMEASTVAVGLPDHAPVTWVGDATGGLSGGVVSVTTMDWFAVATAPWLSVAVHTTVVEPSGSTPGRSLVKLAIEPSASVAVASPKPV